MAALSPGCKPRIPQNYSEIVFLTALDRGTHFSELLRSGKMDLFDPGYFWVLGSGKRCPDPALSLAFFHENPASRNSVIAIPNIVFFLVPHPCPNFGESRIPQLRQIPYPVNVSRIPHCIIVITWTPGIPLHQTLWS